jgi:hypothetical protein
VGTYPEHEFFIERKGPLKHGKGGKMAATRSRGVCSCGYATKWRKFHAALDEDIGSHLNAAEAAGERVSRRRRVRPR